MLLAAATLLLAQVHGDNPDLGCREMRYVFHDAEDLCNTIFGDSFYYEEREHLGYTMWFFDEVNPNDAVTDAWKVEDSANANKYNNSHCHLDSLHKDGPPSKNPGTMTECHPWDDRSCCYTHNVKDVAIINNLYGDGYRWDRCGKLSQACERFWVQEDCFYECDPNVGIFRKFPTATFDANNDDHNAWQIHKMPIKASYCKAWFRACKHDMFCSHKEGDHLQCGALPVHEDPVVDETPKDPATCASGAGSTVTINMYNSGSQGNC